MTRAIQPAEWEDRGACINADPRDFFPEQGFSSKTAKLICNGDPAHDIPPCPVRTECLQWAIDTDEEYGVRGGLDEKERRELKRKNGTHVCECGKRYANFNGLRAHRQIWCKGVAA